MRQEIVVIFLAYQAWVDFRKKEICLWLTGIFGMCGMVYSGLTGNLVPGRLLSLGIGLVFVGISFFTKGAIGMGDGWILLSLGCVLEIWEMVCVLGFGVTLAAFWALMLLVIGKKSRKTELPLVPFLLFGYLGVMLL